MTCKQFYLSFALIVLCLKIQKFPCLLAAAMQKNGVFLILVYFLLNTLGIVLAFFAAKKIKTQTLNFGSPFLRFIKNAVLLFVSFYFFVQGLLLYESIQDLFAHILFDNLPWALFSLLLVVAVFFLANRGIACIARNFELYSFVIVVSIFIISIFGAIETDFTAILPLQEIQLSALVDNFLQFNLWFGDFFLAFALMLVSKELKLKWTVLTYVLSMLFLILLNVEFYGIYHLYAPLQPSLVSVLSEQSMLGVNIGRIDWFLILMTEIGTILGSALCFYLSKESLGITLKKPKLFWVTFAICTVLYVVDSFFLVDIHSKELVFLDYICYFTFAIKILATVIIAIFAIKRVKKEPLPSTSSKGEAKSDRGKAKSETSRARA